MIKFIKFNRLHGRILNKYFSEEAKREEGEKSSNKKGEVKIENYYQFMEENIRNYEFKNREIKSRSESSVIDEAKLTEFLKCPMTNGDLEVTEEGLKISHITYPKRNGVYIIIEEEAQFKF